MLSLYQLIFLSFILFIETGSPTKPVPLQLHVLLLATLLHGLLVSLSRVLGLQAVALPVRVMSLRDLNSGPYICLASTLTNEPPPSHCYSFEQDICTSLCYFKVMLLYYKFNFLSRPHPCTSTAPALESSQLHPAFKLG